MSLVRAMTCLYSTTPDRDFVIGLLPDRPQVAVACGFTSVTHFSKRYSAYFGYPPSKERRLKY